MKAQLHFSKEVNEATALQEACEHVTAQAMSLWEQYVSYDMQGPHRTRTVTRALGYLHGLKHACHLFGRPDLVPLVSQAESDFLASFEMKRREHQGPRPR